MSGSVESSRGGRFWRDFRKEEVACLSRLFTMGSSGAVVGLAGAGKSNLLNYISLFPERVNIAGPARFYALVPVNLNQLVDWQPITLFRLILRACRQARVQFSEPVPAVIEQLYEANITTGDPFLAQTAVYDLLVAVEKTQGRVVLILDQFDRFCHDASPEVTLLLRGLRDSFKETLIYLVGMRQAVMYMPEPTVLGELYQLLDSHVCWVGAMSQADAQQLINREAYRAQQSMTQAEIDRLIALTGSFAALLKAACAWWLALSERPSLTNWRHHLGHYPTIQRRLTDIWQGLTQEDQWLMAQIRSDTLPGQASDAADALVRLAQRGLCEQIAGQWQIKGELLHDFVQTAVQPGLGRIWQKALTGELYQGKKRLEGLRPLEEALLIFFVQNPYKPHTKSEIIRQVWSDGTQIEGVTDDSLYQTVRSVRQKIEPETADSPVYLLTKRGVTEGGYQFFPEGYPAK